MSSVMFSTSTQKKKENPHKKILKKLIPIQPQALAQNFLRCNYAIEIETYQHLGNHLRLELRTHHPLLHSDLSRIPIRRQFFNRSLSVLNPFKIRRAGTLQGLAQSVREMGFSGGLFPIQGKTQRIVGERIEDLIYTECWGWDPVW